MVKEITFFSLEDHISALSSFAAKIRELNTNSLTCSFVAMYAANEANCRRGRDSIAAIKTSSAYHQCCEFATMAGLLNAATDRPVILMLDLELDECGAADLKWPRIPHPGSPQEALGQWIAGRNQPTLIYVYSSKMSAGRIRDQIVALADEGIRLLDEDGLLPVTDRAAALKRLRQGAKAVVISSDEEDRAAYPREAYIAFLNLIDIDYSPLDEFVGNRLGGLSHESNQSDLSRSQWPRHLVDISKLLGEELSNESEFWGRYFDGTLFSDSNPKACEPFYSALKPLVDYKSVTVMCLLLVFWAGMRKRMQLWDRDRIGRVDDLFFDAIENFRELGDCAGEACRKDIVLQELQRGNKLTTALQAVFRVGYDLVLCDLAGEGGVREIQLTNVEVNMDEVIFCYGGLRPTAIWDQLPYVVDPLASFLSSSTPPVLGTGEKKTIRAVVLLNTLLGLGGGGKSRNRKFAHYFTQDSEKGFVIGLERFRE